VVARGVTALVTTHYMDEAEYCGRVGIMRDGKLLAMNSPSELKQHSLPGLAWDVFAHPILSALTVLEQCPCVLRAGLTADHLRAITPIHVDAETLTRSLIDAAIQVEHIELVEPTLEDVFLALADTNVLPISGEKPIE
jgi:ABC-2 type transport system ATP-binding protein